jgi:hypothetical protein
MTPGFTSLGTALEFWGRVSHGAMCGLSRCNDAPGYMKRVYCFVISRPACVRTK